MPRNQLSEIRNPPNSTEKEHSHRPQTTFHTFPHTTTTGTGQPRLFYYELRHREDKLLLELEMAKPGSPEAKAIEDELSMYRQLEAQQNYIMSNRQQSISQMKAS